MSTLRALVVDDDPFVARAMARLLQRRGVEVILSASPGEALATAAAAGGSLAAVITDQRMQPMSGTDLLAEVRRHAPRVLRVLSSGGMPIGERARREVDGTIDMFMLKPWSPDGVYRLVAAMTERARAGK